MFLEKVPENLVDCEAMGVGFIFDDYPELEVLGYFRKGLPLHYYATCHKCAKDPELFPGGLFTSNFQNLKSRRPPCSCGGKFHWSERQWIILLNRASTPKGYKFLGWEGDYKGAPTLCRMRCDSHGEWNTARLSNLVLLGRNCPRCGAEVKSIKAQERLENNPKITAQTFHDTGYFHPDTIFTRLGKIRDTNKNAYWRVDCPLCGLSGESQHTHLLVGGRCCGCNIIENQIQGYINIVFDGDSPVAIKFGISSKYEDRVRRQNQGSVYKVINQSVYYFKDNISCRNAEKYCLDNLTCGIIPRSDMSDGYTETTYCHNIDFIAKVFTDFGGVLQ